MKRRRIIMFFAMIMSVAIIGVGFAAWIITAPTEDAVHEGNFNVDTVELISSDNDENSSLPLTST
jgi:hypothetical protein